MKCTSCNHINPEKSTVCEQCYSPLVVRNSTPLVEKKSVPFAPITATSGTVSLDDLLQNAQIGGAKIARAAQPIPATPAPPGESKLNEALPDMRDMRVDNLLQTKLLDNILNPCPAKPEQLSLEDRSVTDYHNRYGRINEFPEPPTVRQGTQGDFFYVLDDVGEETAYAFPNTARRLIAWAIDNVVMLALSLLAYLSLKLTLLGDATDTAFGVLQKYILGQFSSDQAETYTSAGRAQLERTLGQFNTLNTSALAILLIFVIVPFLYSFLLTGLSGKTFAYFLLDMRVVKHKDGQHIGVSRALVRTLYFSLPQLGCILALYLYPSLLTVVLSLVINLLLYVGQAGAVLNREKRGLHDIVAGAFMLNSQPEARLPNHIYDTVF